MPRVAEESEFVRSLELPGVHVVVDGSSGTGKSSLVLSHLVDRREKHAVVQITNTMGWADLCREVVRQRPRRTSTTGFEMGVDRALPTAKLSVSLSADTERDSNSGGLQLSEHDVAQKMAAANVPLFVDDFDQAQDEIVQRIANLAKLLTQAYESPKAKLIIVGTGDVLRRILGKHRALSERLAHISLGTFGSLDDSWAFLTQGLSKLGVKHPGEARGITEKALLISCKRAVYAAADGLPKSLNTLGQRLCVGADRSRSVSARELIEVAELLPTEFILRHAEAFPRIVELLLKNDAALEVLVVLYERGIGSVHLVSVVANRMGRRYSSGEVDAAIQALTDIGFLTRTGVAGERIYSNDPAIAHNLGVLLSSPNKYDVIRDRYDAGTVKALEEVFSRAMFATRDLTLSN